MHFISFHLISLHFDYLEQPLRLIVYFEQIEAL